MVYGTPKYNDVLTYLTIKSSIIIFFLPLLPNSEVQWVRASSTNMFVMISNLAWVFIVFTILKFVKTYFWIKYCYTTLKIVKRWKYSYYIMYFYLHLFRQVSHTIFRRHDGQEITHQNLLKFLDTSLAKKHHLLKENVHMYFTF